jgi:hypothetical protein
MHYEEGKVTLALTLKILSHLLCCLLLLDPKPHCGLHLLTKSSVGAVWSFHGHFRHLWQANILSSAQCIRQNPWCSLLMFSRLTNAHKKLPKFSDDAGWQAHCQWICSHLALCYSASPKHRKLLVLLPWGLSKLNIRFAGQGCWHLCG